MILFYNYYFRFDSKQVFECFFFPFALLQNYAYSQVEQCVRFVVGDKKQISHIVVNQQYSFI